MKNRVDRGLYWDEAWSLVDGCTKISVGCVNCWAEAQAGIRQHHPNPIVSGRLRHLVTPEGRWTGKIRPAYEMLEKPIHITKPKIFSVWNDLFHGGVPFRFIEEAFQVMAACPQHIFLVLTKRTSRMAGFIEEWEERHERPFDLGNVMLGATTENQEHAQLRIPRLLRIGKIGRFLSVEPILGPIDLTSVKYDQWVTYNALEGCGVYTRGVTGQSSPNMLGNKLDWVIVGAETGPRRRPAKIEWVRSVVQQCQASNVPVFVKKLPGVNGRPTHEMSQWPDDLRIRQYPGGMEIKR